MKPIIFLSLLVLSMTAYGQIDETKLKQLKDSISAVENKFKEKDIKYQQVIKDLNDKLKSSTTLSNRIEALEKKQEIIDKKNEDEFIKEIELTQLRYEGGLLVIKDIMILLDALESQYSTLDFQQSYNDLSNPNQYPEYAQNIDFLKKKLVKSGLTLPEINLGNPVLNVAYTITRSIVSDQPDKNGKISELVCILDFSSQASQNLIIVKNDLKYLQFTLNKMIINYEEIFKNYSSIVGYNKTFREYLKDPNDNIADLTKTYFTSLKNKDHATQDKELKSLRFQLKKIIDAHLEFEIYIRQGLAYYEKFELIMADLKPTCSVAALQTRLTQSHETVKSKLNTAKLKFENAYKDKIKQSYIKQLNEG
jgi:hypothetical protein